MATPQRITSQQWELLRHLATGPTPSDADGTQDREHTAGWLALRTGRRADAVVLSLKRLQPEWVAFRADPRGKRTGRGVPAGYWSITDACREQLEEMDGPPGHDREGEAVPSEESSDAASAADAKAGVAADRVVEVAITGRPWPIRDHQTFVAASAESRDVPALLDVLADGQQAVEASFVARLDGHRHTYVFVFDEALGARPSEALAAALKASGLSYTSGTITEVRGVDAMVRDARAARAAAEAARSSAR